MPATSRPSTGFLRAAEPEGEAERVGLARHQVPGAAVETGGVHPHEHLVVGEPGAATCAEVQDVGRAVAVLHVAVHRPAVLTAPAATSSSPSPARTGRGIVHAVSGFLVEHGGNIVESQQFGDRDTGRFFMRIDFAIADRRRPPTTLRADFAAVAERVRDGLRAVGRRGRRTAR